MDQIPSFEDFLSGQVIEIPVGEFVLNLLIAALLSILLRAIYIRYGKALSNRKSFGWNFVLIAMTTMLIISIVKSSLALSLGLVGALSIVRFRTAIKEPEELSYLFLAIAIGLGLGANQTLITVVAFVVIAAFIVITKRASTKDAHQNLFLTISTHNPQKAELEQIVQVLMDNCETISLKRFDEDEEQLEALFLVEFDDFPQLEATRSGLQELGDQMRVSFLDNKGIVGA
jgi:hypothetical protein